MISLLWRIRALRRTPLIVGVGRTSRAPRSIFLLAGFLLALAGSMALWAGLLALAFHLDLTVLGHPERVPALAAGLYAVALTGSLLGLVWAFWTRLEGRGLAELTGGGPPVRAALSRGITWGLASVLVVSTSELALGWARFVPPHGPFFPLVTAIGVAAAFALSEEVVFRGFVLRTLLRDLPAPIALLLSGYLYAQAHFLRPMDWSRDALPFVLLLGVGLLLGQLVLWTGSIWTSVGLHAVWVYAITVGGQLALWNFPAADFLWTGGNPLGGLLGIGTLVALGVILRNG